MSQQKANLLLVLVTVAWGASYLFTKTAVQEIAPFTLIAYRFLLAFAITAIVFWKQIRRPSKQTIIASAIQGFLMAVVCILFAYALVVTDASVAAFLLATTVIMVPLFMVIWTRKLPTKQVVLGGAITLSGLALFSLDGTFVVSAGMIICLITAALYAVHIIANNHFTQQHDSLQLGVYQLFFVGLFSFIGALFVEPIRLPETAQGWGAVVMLAIVCSAFAIIVQSIAQQHTNAVSTGFIFALEPIFAAIFAYVFLHERLSTQEWMGAAFIFMGVLAANYVPVKSRKAVPISSEL